MAISLQKGGKVSLTKEDAGLKNLLIGLGWNVRQTDGVAFDLDASAFCLGANGKVRKETDFVFFKNLQTEDGTVRHGGDNRTGDGEGDDETITVDLSRLDPRIKSLVFTVNSFTGQNFNQVENASCRVYDATTGEVFAEYNLSQKGSHTGLIMLKVYLHNGEWKVHALGETLNGRVVQQLEDQARQHL